MDMDLLDEDYDDSLEEIDEEYDDLEEYDEGEGYDEDAEYDEYDDDEEFGDDEEEEEEYEEELIQVEYIDKSGIRVTKELTQEQLGRLVSEDYRAEAKESLPKGYDDLVSHFSKDELINTVIQARQQGYSHKQIIEHLSNYLSQSREEEVEPSFETIDEEIDYKVNKKLEAALAQKQQEVSRQQAYQEEMNLIANHNDSYLVDAFDSVGIALERFEKEDFEHLSRIVDEVIAAEGKDFSRHKLTKAQAKAIAREFEEFATSTPDYIKQQREQTYRPAKRPKHQQLAAGVTGRKTSTRQGRESAKIDNVSHSEKMRRFNEF